MATKKPAAKKKAPALSEPEQTALDQKKRMEARRAEQAEGSANRAINEAEARAQVRSAAQQALDRLENKQ